MINADMKTYNYFTFGENNAYGQPQLSAQPVGTIKISINVTSQTTQDNINYKGANYIGLTHAAIDDSYVIEYGTERLKVIYTQPKGRYIQAFMVRM